MKLKKPSSVISTGSSATGLQRRSCTACPQPRGPADGLHVEIFCLARKNEENARMLSAMANQHSSSPGEAVPLRLQVRRLNQRKRSGGGGRGWAMWCWSRGG